MEINDNLILRFQRCESTREEEEALLDWLDESQDHRERMDRANLLFCASVLNGKRKSRSLHRIWWYAAAACFAVLAVGLGLRFFRQKAVPGEDLLAESVTVEATSASKTRISLPDGSIVWLNAGSTLAYSKTFDRTVSLDGEGYFDIVHQEENPFEVEVSGLRLEVLGTVFNVRAYSSENEVKTTLASGSLRLSDKKGNRLFLLHPGEQVSCQADGSQLEVTAVDAWALLLETYGVVTIPDASLTQLCTILNSVYGVTVRASADDGTPITFSFSKDSSVEEVVARLSALSGKKIDIR